MSRPSFGDNPKLKINKPICRII
uniref:Uncharacterized protein n=1 Tax=Arundo donax TaxID=35708 RepID=A0A0A8YZF6_ARUDO